MDDQSETEVVLSCRLVSVSAGPGSDITVFKRRDFEKQKCPADFRVKDSEGNEFLLSAVIRAIPSMPANSPCGSELNALVRYDIDKTGETVNVEAISGAPEKWVKRSRKAVDAMKFDPYLVDGESLDIKGIEMSFKGSVEC